VKKTTSDLHQLETGLMLLCSTRSAEITESSFFFKQLYMNLLVRRALTRTWLTPRPHRFADDIMT
jgi:hypothetical protein